MSNQQANPTNFCAHEWKRDVILQETSTQVWRCEKCNAAQGTTALQNIGGTQKANLKASA